MIHNCRGRDFLEGNNRYRRCSNAIIDDNKEKLILLQPKPKNLALYKALTLSITPQILPGSNYDRLTHHPK